MAYEMREGQGSLFKNNKSTNENAPQATGSAMIDGRIYRISAWTKGPDKNGDKWQSLKIEPQDGTRKDTRPMAEQLDDFVPF